MSNLILPPNLFYTFHAECNYHDALQCFYRGNWALQGFGRTPGGGRKRGRGRGLGTGRKGAGAIQEAERRGKKRDSQDGWK